MGVSLPEAVVIVSLRHVVMVWTIPCPVRMPQSRRAGNQHTDCHDYSNGTAVCHALPIPKPTRCMLKG